MFIGEIKIQRFTHICYSYIQGNSRSPGVETQTDIIFLP